MIFQEPHIFLVDDDPDFRSIVAKKIGANKKLKITHFESGEAALRNINLKPNIVILDFSMQSLNGLDTLRAIKNKRPASQVIIFTSIQNEKLAQECLRNGAAEFLNKGDLASLETISQHINFFDDKKKRRDKVYTLIAFIIILSGIIIFSMI